MQEEVFHAQKDPLLGPKRRGKEGRSQQFRGGPRRSFPTTTKGKRLRRVRGAPGRRVPTGASGGSPEPISARKRSIFPAEHSYGDAEGVAGLFCAKNEPERPTNGLNRAGCRRPREDRRATAVGEEGPEHNKKAVVLRRFWTVFQDFCSRRKSSTRGTRR